MTIIVTPGDPAANSYTTVQYMRDYAALRPHAPDLSLFTDVDLEKYLVHNTLLLDTCRPKGVKTFLAGARLWPRAYVRNNEPWNWVYYDETLIPPPLEDGLVEMSLESIAVNLTAEPSLAGYARVKIDTLEFVADASTDKPVFPRSATIILDHLFVSFSGAKQTSHPVMRV